MALESKGADNLYRDAWLKVSQFEYLRLSETRSILW